MAEISREDAIKMLKAYHKCQTKKCKGVYAECNEELCNYCGLCYEQGTWGEHKLSVLQAISDMEKLEKIEQIVDEWENREFNSELDHIERIEQILKGEQ